MTPSQGKRNGRYEHSTSRVSQMERDASRFTVEMLRSVKAEVWNAWISQASGGTIFQTTFWADRLCELWDCHPYFFVVRHRNADLPTLVLLGFDIHSDLIIGKHTTLTMRFVDKARKVLAMNRRFQWFGLPALINPQDGDEAYRVLLCEIEHFCRRDQICAIGPSEMPILVRASIPRHWENKQWATFIIDLRQSEDDLGKNLKKTARKAIHRAQEDGIVVRRISSLEDLRSYFDFACQCATRYGKKMYDFVDFETMWRHFRPHAIFETFVAEKDREPLAGLSIWGYNGIISELGSFQSERSFREKLYGSDLIKWEVMRWGLQQGYRTYDLAGVNPEPKTPKEQGIRQFKEKWGGQYQPYCIVSWKATQSRIQKIMRFVFNRMHRIG